MLIECLPVMQCMSYQGDVIRFKYPNKKAFVSVFKGTHKYFICIYASNGFNTAWACEYSTGEFCLDHPEWVPKYCYRLIKAAMKYRRHLINNGSPINQVVVA